MIVNVGVDAGKLLQRLYSSKPEHRPLSSSEGEVTVLAPVVGPASHLLLFGATQFGHRRPVGFETVGDDLLWRAVTLQSLFHEGQRRMLVAGLRHIASRP